MSKLYCATCQQCYGRCHRHSRTDMLGGFNIKFPDQRCNDFQPDPERAGAIWNDKFYRSCATCRFYHPNCNIYEKDCYNDTPVCQNYDEYHEV